MWILIMITMFGPAATGVDSVGLYKGQAFCAKIADTLNEAQENPQNGLWVVYTCIEIKEGQ